MSEDNTSKYGKIGWVDLTIDDAEGLRDFYMSVLGWAPQPVDMEGYQDYAMLPTEQDETPVAGVCHARGPNVGLPKQWLIYVTVPDLDASIAACESNGGQVIVPPRPVGGERMCVIQDPAGAVMAIMGP